MCFAMFLTCLVQSSIFFYSYIQWTSYHLIWKHFHILLKSTMMLAIKDIAFSSFKSQHQKLLLSLSIPFISFEFITLCSERWIFWRNIFLFISESGLVWSPPVGIWSNLWRKIPAFYWFPCFLLTHFLLLLMSDTTDSSRRLPWGVIVTVIMIIMIIVVIMLIIAIIVDTKFQCEIHYSD